MSMKCFVSFNNKHLKKKAKRKSCVCLRQFEHFVLIKCLFLFAVILMLQQSVVGLVIQMYMNLNVYIIVKLF